MKDQLAADSMLEVPLIKPGASCSLTLTAGGGGGGLGEAGEGPRGGQGRTGAAFPSPQQLPAYSRLSFSPIL